LLSLASVAANPRLLTASVIADGETLLIRPLEPADVEALAHFLSQLSPQTRRFSTFDGFDSAAAQTLCHAIARYDKLRIVIQSAANRIVGLLEFSFAITDDDRLRYTAYDVTFSSETDCRFGPTLADDYQSRGIGTLALPFVTDAARKFGRRRIILWGGVLAENARAIRYYEKNGFQRMGKFMSPDGVESLDMLLDL
jgi:RimJ/RimL family protein N-acetyltransferase